MRSLGDMHWQVICEALKRNSRDMVDLAGNRLYASFVRVCWSSTLPLSGYHESDRLTGWLEMRRCGDGVFLSTSELQGSNGGIISARLASIFTRRETATNDRLLASSPPIFDHCPIPDIGTAPPFLNEHRELRTGKLAQHTFMNFTFDTTAPIGDSSGYWINGYQDFNGANLLYFASYPTIADICASRTRYITETFGFERFVTKSSPLGRDLFYFGNANLGDFIHCEFSLSPVESWLLAARIDLIRNVGGTLIGKQFVVRERPS